MKKLSIYNIDDRWMVYVCVPPREVDDSTWQLCNHDKDHEYIFDTFEEVIVFMRMGGGRVHGDSTKKGDSNERTENERQTSTE